ncbi:MAG TPA: hypothetical protein VLH79_11030 [Chthonomonadales bacterium]|nr:hypothetical protein [Chthonomonadales bacterium]
MRSGIARRQPRARRRACLSRLLTWALGHGVLPSNRTEMADRVRREPRVTRGVGRTVVHWMVAVIPPEQERDRLLFALPIFAMRHELTRQATPR